MNKPTKPNITIPASFGGVKSDFDNSHLTNGFPQLTADVLPGDCLNKLIDDTYKGLNFSIAGVDDLYKGAVLYSATETYSSTSLVFNISGTDIKLYHSLVNNNIGNSLSDTTKWEEVDLGGASALVDLTDVSISSLTNNDMIMYNSSTTKFENVATAQIDGSLGMPSTRYTDLTLGASGSTYTAPANGWFALSKFAGGNNKNIFMQNTSNQLLTISFGPTTGEWCCVYIPCRKDDAILISYSATGSVIYFRFIYAEGDYNV